MKNNLEFTYHQKKVLIIIKTLINREDSLTFPFCERDIIEIACFSGAVVKEVFFFLEKMELIKMIGFNTSYPGDQVWQLTEQGINTILSIW